MSNTAWSALTRRLGFRVLTAAGVLLVVSLVMFVAVASVPGDAVDQLVGADATERDRAALRAEYGLDDPVWRRYGDWLAGLVRGDLGRSLTTGRPVTELLAGPVGRSGVLAGVAAVAIVLLGVGGGIVAGLRPLGPVDRMISTAALLVASVPEFVVAALLILLLATGLGWLPSVSLLPSSGSIWDSPDLLVLPAISVALLGSALVLRLVRPVVAAQSGSAHVEAATLEGLSRTTVLRRHLLPGTVGPVAQALATIVPYLVGGTVVVEQVFSYPGLGSLFVGAVAARDPLVVQGIAVLLAATTLTAYLLADLAALASNPRRWVR